jgi:predicted nucleic acid-binding protein
MQQLPLPVLMTPLGELELVNALQLRLFRKEVVRSEARAARAAFSADMRGGVFAMRAWAAEAFAEAIRLASRWTAGLGTRTFDILHVAAAVSLGADVFHTFDARQRKLARAVGLVVA